MFSSSYSDGEVFFSFRFFFYWVSPVLLEPCHYLLLFPLAPVGRHYFIVCGGVCVCVSLVDVAVQKNNRTKVVLLTLSFRKLLGWEGTAKNTSLHLNVFYLAPL